MKDQEILVVETHAQECVNIENDRVKKRIERKSDALSLSKRTTQKRIWDQSIVL